MSKKALICGISGQDGAYLADFLLKKNYEIYGASRDVQARDFYNLRYLNILNQVQYISLAVSDFRNVIQSLKKIMPDEIYNLSGQSSVGLSFEQPLETMESISVGTLNILEGIRLMGIPASFYNAGSGECFGDTNGLPANENTPFKPRSPYAVAKSAAFWEVANYREAYHLHASTGILFNHESPLRSERYVTRKIVATAARIAKGSKEKLVLGNIEIKRDWGWAPDYIEAMWLMLQQDQPDDYVIATGETRSLREFIETAFKYVGLDWRSHITIDPELFRPTDLVCGCANPAKAREKLKWQAKYKMKDIVRMMMEAEIKRIPEKG